jgi:hypothetical protein
MAQFRLLETPPFGTCLTCGTSACPEGFVDLIAAVKVVRDNYEIVGDVDVVLCAACIEQASNMVGALSIKESELLFENLSNLQVNYAKAADEAAAWQQRYENLVEIMSLLELAPKEGDSREASLLELKEKDAPSDSDIKFMPAIEPKPDLRVQESGKLASKSTRKAKKSSGS